MKIKIVCFVFLGWLVFFMAGCHTTEERLTNMGESIHNIALDGDGVN